MLIDILPGPGSSSTGVCADEICLNIEVSWLMDFVVLKPKFENLADPTRHPSQISRITFCPLESGPVDVQRFEEAEAATTTLKVNLQVPADES
jgi:hypothetical protein